MMNTKKTENSPPWIFPAEFPQLLLDWYSVSARVLPWRENRDPYRIMVSESMLQQTRVDTVIPYYRRFLEELPDTAALAAVSEDRLMKLWQGLGYYRRAKSLQKAAQVIETEFHGVFPDTIENLRKLPGVGAYSAGSIGSIAFELPEPAVDGNVMRVAARLLNRAEGADSIPARNGVTEGLRKIFPERRRGDFTQSIMDLGATVCVPNGEPLCSKCPVRSICLGYAAGTMRDLPPKPEKKARVSEEKTVFILECLDRIALRKRPETGLLSGLWEPVNTPGKLNPEQAARFLKGLEKSAVLGENLGEAVHIFTHREWRMTGYRAAIPKNPKILNLPDLPGIVWALPEELRKDYSVPSAFRAYMKHIKKTGSSK